METPGIVEEEGIKRSVGPGGEIISEDDNVIISVLDKSPPVEPGVMRPNETTVYIDIFSKAEMRHYTGDFTFKRLNLGDTAIVGAERARRNGGVVDESTDLLNSMLAYLNRAIVKGPDWAKDLSKLYDLYVVASLYYEVLKFEARFRRAVP